MKTPYFMIYEERLKSNINDFTEALKTVWSYSQIAYSVKTNSLPWLLKYLKGTDLWAEVVSDEEYHLAEKCGYSKSEIIFNGPIKTTNQLIEAIYGRSIVNLDSRNDVETLLSLNLESINNIGLRINVSSDFFDKQDVEYQDNGFRFGFSDETGDLEEIISKIKTKFGTTRFGLHLHCNSITRSLNVYRVLAQSAANIIKKYRVEPSFIDIGGGFFGGVQGKPTALQYIEAIKEELCEAVDMNKTRLIIEPGSAIICSAVDLITSVIDVKQTSKARIVTTDGSRIHIDPLWKKERYQYSIMKETEHSNIKDKQVICGYTCMDHDRIMIVYDEPELKVGDIISYHKVGAYSMTFGGPFIRYFPEVYVQMMSGETVKVRHRMDVDEYYLIQQ